MIPHNDDSHQFARWRQRLADVVSGANKT